MSTAELEQQMDKLFADLQRDLGDSFPEDQITAVGHAEYKSIRQRAPINDFIRSSFTASPRRSSSRADATSYTRQPELRLSLTKRTSPTAEGAGREGGRERCGLNWQARSPPGDRGERHPATVPPGHGHIENVAQTRYELQLVHKLDRVADRSEPDHDGTEDRRSRSQLAPRSAHGEQPRGNACAAEHERKTKPEQEEHPQVSTAVQRVMS
jgi:hypothetical protein